MSKEKTQEHIGKILTEPMGRDAIHIAVAPVTASRTLLPGQHIGFVQFDNTELVGKTDKPIGIVDPFLPDAVLKGERFFMFLYPNTITSLNHVWTHTAFAEQSVTDKPADNRSEK